MDGCKAGDLKVVGSNMLVNFCLNTFQVEHVNDDVKERFDRVCGNYTMAGIERIGRYVRLSVK